MDLTTRSEAFGTDKRDWLGSAHAAESGETITLAGSEFTGVFTDGNVPSGVVVGRITATKKYAPFPAGTDEVQSLVATGGASGTFTLTLDGETTTAIAYDAAAAAVQAALEALSNVNPGDIVATGGPLPTTPVVLTWGGQYGETDMPALVVTDSITGGDAVITTTTAGSAGASDGREDPAQARLLLWPVKVKSAAGATIDPQGVTMWHGRVKKSKLPRTAGTLGGLDDDVISALSAIVFVD